jgi:hypothetical protein
MWTITINQQNNNSYSLYNKTGTIITLTNSFAHFLSIFLNGGVFDGIYKWQESVDKNKR